MAASCHPLELRLRNPVSLLSSLSYSRHRLGLTAVLLLVTPLLPSQQTPTFSSDVKVVNVLATVRDKHGQIVNNLTKDDFKLQADGQPQTIRYFARDTDLPLKLGLLVDTSASQRRLIDQERTASYGFLNDLMRVDKDKAFVIHFDSEVELLQDMTDSHEKLEAALDKLGAPQFQNTGGGAQGGGGSGGGYPGNGGGGQSGGHRMGGGTALYDAVFLASDELMRKEDGRKALIVLTDGVDNASKVSLDRAIETSQKANTLVYSILYSDPDAYSHQGYPGGMGRHGGWGGMGRYPGGGYPGGGYPQQTQHPDGKKVLQRLSKETGGRFFEVTKKESVSQIYSQIEEELRNQYNLGFAPDKALAMPGYHKLNLTTTNKDLTVEAQEEYYAGQ
jgi:VWFA-related protein